MKLSLILLFTIIGYSQLISQSKGDSISVRLNFEQLAVKEIASYNSHKYLKFDFKIVDSSYFEQYSHDLDITNTENFKTDFELTTWDSKTIEFICSDGIKERCPTYLGYSENMEGHLVSKCKDICETYLIDATNGSTIVLPSYFDGGGIPLFSYENMIIYASYYDDTYENYYDYRSVIDVFKILDSDKPIEKRFEYLGSINSTNWSIDDIVINSDNPNSFIIKLYEVDNKFDYIEIEWK